MLFISLIVTVILAFLTGFFYVKYLTVHPVKMSLFLTITILCAMGTILVMANDPPNQNVYISIILSIFLCIGGYVFATWMLMNMPDNRTIPSLTRSPHDPGDGHTAIVYFTHGEPGTYTPIAWINQFKEYDATGVKFVPFLARPFFINSSRNDRIS
jgi:hypothetical protein